MVKKCAPFVAIAIAMVIEVATNKIYKLRDTSLPLTKLVDTALASTDSCRFHDERT